MKSAKRVILAHNSRLLREMLHRVIDKASHLEVVREVPNHEELSFAIERFDPEWVIASLPFRSPSDHWINSCIADYPSVRFVLLSPDQNYIKMIWHTSHEEDYPDLSLKEFFHFLERDFQRS